VKTFSKYTHLTKLNDPTADSLLIPGYPEYMADPAGNIFSHRGRYWRRLKPKAHSLGYRQITLCNDKGSKMFFVHRIVAQMFVPGFKRGLTVNHKNLNKADNRAENLEWLTFRDNQRHWRRENPEAVARAKEIVSEVISRPCVAIDPTDPTARHEFGSLTKAGLWASPMNKAAGNICKALKYGKIAYGFRWEYL
jgi:hypothetical protein